jgi:hypothetical protein
MLKDNKMLNSIRKNLNENGQMHFEHANDTKSSNINADLMQKIICSN